MAPSLALAACSDDPVSFSAPVGINFKAKSGDVQEAVVTDEKNINTESGNPYGAFVAEARTALGDQDPARIEVEGVTLLLGGQSVGVTMLGEIYNGDVEALFVMNDTDDTFPVGTVAVNADTAGGPIDFDVDFDSDAVQADNYAKLLGGSFKVVLRGPAAAAFVDKGADANLQATFTFGAYEE